MHSRFKFIVPLSLLFCFGCIDVPPVEPPTTSPDGGVDPGQKEEGFTLAVAPVRASVIQGRSQSLQLTLTRVGGFSGSVTVSAVNAPAGVTVLPVTIPAGSTSASLEVLVGEGAEPGIQVVPLRGTAGALSHEVSFELTVVKLGDLLVGWASPGPDTVYVNGALSLHVAVEGGTADYVEVLRNETVVQRLSGPSYQYTWDTTQVPEQTYTLTARAVRGAKTFTSTTAKTVVVDRTAPEVVSRTPAPGATNVSVRDAIQVSFSEALSPASVTDSSVLVTAGSTDIVKTLSLSADGKTLTVTPASPLPVESTVTMRLGTATAPVTDLAGNAVPATTQWTFTVPTWLPMGGAISALPGNTPATSVDLKVDREGNPIVAWSEFDGAENNIYVRRWNDISQEWRSLGGGLSDVSGANTNAQSPALAVDAFGQVSVVWSETGGLKGFAARRWNGSGWDALPAFPNVSVAEHRRTSPSLVVDGKGKLTVASMYFNSVGVETEIFSLEAGQSSWEKVPFSLSGVAQPSSPVLAVDASGALSVAFSGLDIDSYRGMCVARLLGGGSWSLTGDMVHSESGVPISHVSMALDGAGAPVVAWEESEFRDGVLVRSDVYVVQWVGTSWEKLGGVIDGGTLNTEPFVLMGSDGQPLVVRSGVVSSERSILVSKWSGGSWQSVGPPLSARAGSSTAAFSPVMALDKNGYPLVAWHESDGSVTDIYVYRYNY